MISVVGGEAEEGLFSGGSRTLEIPAPFPIHAMRRIAPPPPQGHETAIPLQMGAQTLRVESDRYLSERSALWVLAAWGWELPQGWACHGSGDLAHREAA